MPVVKLPRKGSWSSAILSTLLPLDFSGPFQTIAPFALWVLCWCLSVILFWGCNGTEGCRDVCQRKSWSISYLENSLNKISKINEVNYLPKIISLTKTSAEVLLVPQPKVRCDEVWDVNWIYVYFCDYFLKIKLESNTALIWPQGLSSACRSGSWLQRRWKHKQKGEAGQNDVVAMASQSWAWFWVLFHINEAFWSVGRSSSVPPLTATVEKLATAKLLSTSVQMRSSTALSEADCNFTCLKQSLLGAEGWRGRWERSPICSTFVQYLPNGMGGCGSPLPWNNIINHKMLRARGFTDARIQPHTFKIGLFTGRPSNLPALLGE